MISLAKPMLGIEEKTLVNEVLSSGKLAHGEYVEMFEREVDYIVNSLQKYE